MTFKPDGTLVIVKPFQEEIEQIAKKHIIEHNNLSSTAKILLLYMLNRTDNNMTTDELLKIATEGIYSKRKALVELEDMGFLIRERPRGIGYKGGYGKTVYYVFCRPHTVASSEISRIPGLSEKLRDLTREKLGLPKNKKILQFPNKGATEK